MMKIRLIHGIHEPEGKSNMAEFEPYIRRAFPQAKVELFSYGFMGFWQARWENDNVARDLAATSQLDAMPGKELWITHSNGAAVAYLATERHAAAPDMIVNINPALDRWRTAAIRAVETIHSDQDRWVELSQLLPFNVWGDQGKVGYKGRLHNTLNHNASAFSGVMAYSGHCDLFTPKRMGPWASFIAVRTEERIGI